MKEILHLDYTVLEVNVTCSLYELTVVYQKVYKIVKGFISSLDSRGEPFTSSPS